MKSTKSEETQSRREFFKSSARAALPILGALVLTNLPICAQAMETGCGGSCEGSCKGTCEGSCTGSCSSGCKGGCSYSCAGSASR